MVPIAPNARPPSRELLRGNLIFERARAGLSQAGLADAAGLSRQTISEIERGATNPSLDVIDRIVGALGITIDTGKRFLENPSVLRYAQHRHRREVVT